MHARQTPLFDRHGEAGARFTDFAGWRMPLHYPAGSIAEHITCRNSAALFDISHMSQFVISGAEAGNALARACSRDVTRIPVESSSYALLCRDDGGVIDDIFVYRTGNEEYLVVGNAARAEVDRNILEQRTTDVNADFRDISDDTAMLALQGPRTHAIAEALFGPKTTEIERFGIRFHQFDNRTIHIARTGYTGEDGFELFLEASAAADLWTRIIETAGAIGVDLLPAGLAARDSLRLEAGFALYGHEISEEVTPVEARLLWACDNDHDYIGRDAIAARRSAGPQQKLQRLVMEEQGVPREGYRVVDTEGHPRGVVVSGGRAPTLDRFIANAFVDSDAGSDLFIEIRSRKHRVTRQNGPFYRSSYRRVNSVPQLFEREGEYLRRHVGITESERREMLRTVGAESLEELISKTVPEEIRRASHISIGAHTEEEVSRRLAELAAKNTVSRALIGMGFADSITPAVIRRTILENPRWYTQYTPYQAEISQGRLEALLNFQTMVCDLTGMELAGASLLDEATAAGEALMTAYRLSHATGPHRVWVSSDLFPQVIAHLETKASPHEIEIVVAPVDKWQPAAGDIAGFVQYPGDSGVISRFDDVAKSLHDVGALLVVGCDLLALTILTPPREWGADLVYGSTGRFGVPLSFGGPHAAFLASPKKNRRALPGRIVGVSKDSRGKPAMRLALQTREQHIRRDKATSNICTAQVLPAILASMYAVYHGPAGLRGIAERIATLSALLATRLKSGGFDVSPGPVFDTVTIEIDPRHRDRITKSAEERGYTLRERPTGLSVSLDERSSLEELTEILSLFSIAATVDELKAMAAAHAYRPHPSLERTSSYMTHPVFHDHHSETKIMRYIDSLANKDLSLAHSMIPLGSCTMKLTPTTAMEAIALPGFARIHPYAPSGHTEGYAQLAGELEKWLCDITGFDACTLQPNSGAQGEYTGLMIVRAYHRARGQAQRSVCLVPDSAHGTNPASAVMAGMTVVVVKSDHDGAIDLEDLEARAREAGDRLAAIMVTYPSTHGVFERGIREAGDIVHQHGGLVYMDGANMNAQIGLTSPAEIGADVCHLNLHKTFAIPHGGGGPGVGPVAVRSFLAPYLPGTIDDPGPTGVVVGSPLGSGGILPISWAYIALTGGLGLRRISETAILNANYIARRVATRIPIAYTGHNGYVAHECILDFRAVERETGVTVEDIAKRLADYGFHAPTMSWPVHGTLMVEPTESESKDEIDRFCDAILSIADEIDEIGAGKVALEESPLRRAPHTLADITGDWDRPYSRETGAYPAPWLRDNKFWPSVNRVDNVYGDRNLMCSCIPVGEYT